MDMKVIDDLVKNQLSESRYAHTLRVTETALGLADLHGGRGDEVEKAAMLHDYAKDMDSEQLKQAIKKYGLPEDLLNYHVELWHGPVAAKICEHQFHIKNEAILNAIYYHTTGREKMGLTELIVFVADYIEPGRNFPGVEEARSLARKDILLAARFAVKHTIQFLLSKDATIHPNTFLAYNDLTKKIGVSKD